LGGINQSVNHVIQRTAKSSTPKLARRRPRRGVDHNSRDVLLDAAAELMNERNSIDISFSDLAKHAKRNSALVKYYFGNKEGLLLALLKRDAAKAIAELEHLIALEAPIEEKLQRHIAAVIVTFHRSPYLNRLLHAMLDDRNSNSASAKQLAEFLVKPFVRLQRKLLEQGVKARRLRKVDPMFFYVSVLGACDFIFNARFTLRSVYGVPRMTDRLRQSYIEHVTDMVLNGMAVKDR
jgi:AcrR family transcriptional regulator